MTEPKRRVLAVASGGGHWIQLMRLAPAWDGCAVTYVTTTDGFRKEIQSKARSEGAPQPRYYVVPEAHRWQKARLVRQLLMLAWVFLRTRPHAVITTGAAPGYFAIRLGHLMGAQCAWVDSIANAEELSLSGKQVGRYADIWLTQWEHLASEDGPHHEGSVL